jgi:hypothetical protein
MPKAPQDGTRVSKGDVATYNSNVTANESRRAATNIRVALDLSEAAEKIALQNLRRRHPDATPEEIEQKLLEWLLNRPGAEHGDGVGRPVSRFEQRP